MTLGATWLIDKSALTRLGHLSDSETWADRVQRGLVQICTVTLLETGFSARSGDDWARIHAHSPVRSMPHVLMTPGMERRSIEVQGLLAQSGQHRAPSVADLLVAAVAELAGLVVLHDDKDFDLIASVTGQPVERLALS